MINCINWIDGLDGLSTGRVAHRGPDPGRHLHHGGTHRAPRGAVVRRARGLLGRLPALELPPRPGVHRHGRRDGRGLCPGGAVHHGHGQGRRGAAGPGRAHHRYLLDHHPPPGVRRLALRGRSGSSPPSIARPGPDASRRGAADLRHRGRPGRQRPAAVVVGRGSAVRVPGHRHRGRASALYLLTRHTRNSLDASSYPDEPRRGRPRATGADVRRPNGSGTPGHGTRPA